MTLHKIDREKLAEAISSAEILVADVHNRFIGRSIDPDARRRTENTILPLLINAGLSKNDCFNILKDAGVSLPRTYTEASRFGSGYPNANCIGCVKATSPTYWNHVRETRPEVFEARAKLSRELGVRLVRVKGKRIFLDELNPDARGRDMRTMNVECGILCERQNHDQQ